MSNRFTDTADRASRKVSGEPVYTQREVEEVLRSILDRLAYDKPPVDQRSADTLTFAANIVRDQFAKIGVRP